MRMTNTSLYMCECFFVSRSTRMLDQQIPSDSWSQVFCVNACLPLSPLLHLFYWSPRFPLSMFTSCLILLFVSFTLFISPASLYSLSLSTSSRCQQRNLFHLLPPHLHRLILSQGPGKTGREKERVENGVFFHVVLPFLLLICCFFAGRTSLSHISETRKEKKHGEGVRDGTEQRGRESQKVIFFLRVVRPCRVSEKKGTRGERKNA